MLDGIPIGAVSDGSGTVGVILIVGFMIMIGRLHSDREFKRMEELHIREAEDLAHDRDEWRAAHRISEQARVEERENTKSLIDGFGITLTNFLEGFRRAADEAHERREGRQR